MADPFKKAKDADRDAAVAAVEAAYADGQLSKPDSELRVARLQQSRTMAEIQVLTRDLHVADPPVGVAPRRPTDLVGAAREATPTRHVAERPETGGRTVAGLLVAAVVVVVMIGVGMAGVLFVGATGGSDVATSRQVERVAVDKTTARGYDELVAALADKTGSTEVFNATIYPEYAVLEVPVADSGRRSFGWYYDGRWQEWTGKGTATDERFDLADLDGRTVATTVKKTRRLVDEPSAAYVLVNARGRDETVCLSAYVTNELDQLAYVDATCDGAVVTRYVS